MSDGLKSAVEEAEKWLTDNNRRVQPTGNKETDMECLDRLCWKHPWLTGMLLFVLAISLIEQTTKLLAFINAL